MIIYSQFEVNGIIVAMPAALIVARVDFYYTILRQQYGVNLTLMIRQKLKLGTVLLTLLLPRVMMNGTALSRD